MQGPVRWLTVPASLGALLFAGLHVAFRDEHYSVLAGILSGLNGALALLAFLRYRAVRPDHFPAIEVMLGLHYFQYGLPITVPPHELGVWRVVPSSASTDVAALLALGCALTLVGGFAFVLRLVRPIAALPVVPNLRREDLARAAPLYIPLAGAWLLSYNLARSDLHAGAGTAFAIFSTVLSAVPMAVIATAVLVFSPTFGARVRFLLMCLVCLVSMAVSGMLTHAATPLAAAALVWVRLRGRIPLVLVAVVAAVLLVLQPVKSHYRGIRWGNESRVGVVQAWGEAFADAASLGRLTRGGEEARSRFSELDVLAYTIELVPGAVPHSHGRAYEITLFSAIPRVLWPDKPNMSMAGTDAFTIPLGLQTRELAELSATGLSIPPHGYLEHGVVGSLGWMGLVGLAFGLIVRVFGRGIAAELAVPTVGVSMAFATGGGFVSFFGSIWQSLFGTLMLLWLLHGVGRALTLFRPTARADAIPLSKRA